MNEPQFQGEAMKLPNNQDGRQTTITNHGAAFGLIITLLFLALILVLGGLFLWYRTTQITPTVSSTPTDRPTAAENNEPESTTAEARADALMTLSTSNEIEAIDADIRSTDLTSVEVDITGIDAELNTLDSVVEPPQGR